MIAVLKRLAAVRVDWQRKNPIFFEHDGSFNPFFVLIGILVAVQCTVTLWVFVRNGSSIVQGAALSLLGVTINIFVMAAVSQSKAKIIANARSTGDIAKGIADAVRPSFVEPETDYNRNELPIIDEPATSTSYGV